VDRGHTIKASPLRTDGSGDRLYQPRPPPRRELEDRPPDAPPEGREPQLLRRLGG